MCPQPLVVDVGLLHQRLQRLKTTLDHGWHDPSGPVFDRAAATTEGLRWKLRAGGGIQWKTGHHFRGFYTITHESGSLRHERELQGVMTSVHGLRCADVHEST